VSCIACRVEEEGHTPAEAFVLGIMLGGLQDKGRLRMEGTLCDFHGRFPHPDGEAMRSILKALATPTPAPSALDVLHARLMCRQVQLPAVTFTSGEIRSIFEAADG
jgi:hypothetical protein